MNAFGAQPTAAITWVRRLALVAFLLCFVVVVLGAFVRLNAAGLGCPDWPGCYGHLTPTGAAENVTAQAAYPNTPLHVGKAWKEMIHRYAASTLGLIIVVITALAISTRKQRVVSRAARGRPPDHRRHPGNAGRAHRHLAAQAAHRDAASDLRDHDAEPAVVAVSFAALGSARRSALRRWFVMRAPVPIQIGADPHRQLMLVALIALGIQVALGGWVSSNYAAVACPDFPKCQNCWIPETDYKDAFVLWRGLGVNYEGGILQHPARVAIHYTHRLGAVVATIALLVAAIAALRRKNSRSGTRIAAYAVLAALGLQLFIGASMVLEGFPLALATAHNAGAALLVLASVALYRSLRNG